MGNELMLNYFVIGDSNEFQGGPLRGGVLVALVLVLASRGAPTRQRPHAAAVHIPFAGA